LAFGQPRKLLGGKTILHNNHLLDEFNKGAGAGFGVEVLQHASDVGKRQPQAPQGNHDMKAAQIRLGVAAMPGSRSARRGHQSDLLVVAQGPDRQSGRRRDLADPPPAPTDPAAGAGAGAVAKAGADADPDPAAGAGAVAVAVHGGNAKTSRGVRCKLSA